MVTLHVLLYTTLRNQTYCIFSKHWQVVKEDHIIGPLLPDKADVIYIGAPSLQMRLASNIIKPPSQPTFFHNLKGYYPCKKCNVCLHNFLGRKKTISFILNVTQRSYFIKPFITCATTNIVYLITCPCGKHVGRTT